MYYVQEGTSLQKIIDSNEDFNSLNLIKTFDNLTDAWIHVCLLINLKPKTSFVGTVIGKQFVGFDYGSWSHFYFITSDTKLDYSLIYKMKLD